MHLSWLILRAIPIKRVRANNFASDSPCTNTHVRSLCARVSRAHAHTHTLTPSTYPGVDDGAVLRVFNLNILWRASGTFSFGEARWENSFRPPEEKKIPKDTHRRARCENVEKMAKAEKIASLSAKYPWIICGRSNRNCIIAYWNWNICVCVCALGGGS